MCGPRERERECPASPGGRGARASGSRASSGRASRSGRPGRTPGAAAGPSRGRARVTRRRVRVGRRLSPLGRSCVRMGSGTSRAPSSRGCDVAGCALGAARKHARLDRGELGGRGNGVGTGTHAAAAGSRGPRPDDGDHRRRGAARSSAGEGRGNAAVAGSRVYLDRRLSPLGWARVCLGSGTPRAPSAPRREVEGGPLGAPRTPARVGRGRLGRQRERERERQGRGAPGPGGPAARGRQERIRATCMRSPIFATPARTSSARGATSR